MAQKDIHEIKGFDKKTACVIFDEFGKFYLKEAIKDEQDAVDFYQRAQEKLTNLLDDEDNIKFEHIILDETEHKKMFSDIYNKINKKCQGL